MKPTCSFTHATSLFSHSTQLWFLELLKLFLMKQGISLSSLANFERYFLIIKQCKTETWNWSIFLKIMLLKVFSVGNSHSCFNFISNNYNGSSLYQNFFPSLLSIEKFNVFYQNISVNFIIWVSILYPLSIVFSITVVGLFHRLHFL